MNSTKKKLALFDFDDTLIGFQSADAFVEYVLENYNKKSYWQIEKIRSFLKSHKLINGKYNKRLKLIQLRGISHRIIDVAAIKYVQDILLDKEISIVKDKMLELKSRNYLIGIISGSYFNYLKYYAELYNIDFLICTRILFRNNRCIGTIDGYDCMGENKVTLLKQKIDLDQIDLENSIFFTDHVSDLPLINMFGNNRIVYKKEFPQWARNTSATGLQIND